MRTFSLLKGMQVLDCNGETQGAICDICISDSGKLNSFLLKTNSFFGKLYRLPVEKVVSYGESSLSIGSLKDLERFKSGKDEYTMVHCRPLLLKMAVSPGGEQLGLLEDVYFLEGLGTIVGYELTDGFFSDITEGKKVINTVIPPKMEEAAIIVCE
ncbi:PRC-barrel domain-containing protein [Heyndrickxia acidicola]|uniref:PRC-barrel domain-containing protein n=1 Tax=Heyndrickxia acidicola TaxID=209389 RepID=A0ABU6MNE2_9BACI|nr:PRC-barrel domain-containing protein [Heyndrickxia acidicola]MED1204737.1 PRC-barrel domain-containing protein [Heyndrickxia acidicola]